MVILDEPYASEPLLSWLEESQHPVLANEFSRSLVDRGRALNLIAPGHAAALIDEGQRIYSNSENALSWVLEHSRNENLCRSIELFKDKAEMRARLAQLNPDLFFRKLARADLANVDPSKLPLPVVLKPSVGFCSMGVYVIEHPEDWDRALQDIAHEEASWNERYPQSVVDAESYLVEGYLEGEEYALDAYFDEEGRAHLLNVFRHDFAGSDDTSDRLYRVSSSIIDRRAPAFSTWLDKVNEVVGAHAFPVHVEVRVKGDTIVPIEFNPLRFAGLGGTDLAYYAWGVRTYEAFLEGKDPDIAHLAARQPNATWSMSLLTPRSTEEAARAFDYDRFAERFSHVLELRRFDAEKVGSWAFLFLQTDEASADELDFILHVDLAEYLLSRRSSAIPEAR